MKKLLGALTGLAMLAGASSAANAFSCPVEFAEAEAAIASAKTAMEAMPDGTNKGLVHTLIDDAKMLLHSAKHNHEKPAAGGYDHARAVAKARSAVGYAEAAATLASK
jgi:hypothetical protein